MPHAQLYVPVLGLNQQSRMHPLHSHFGVAGFAAPLRLRGTLAASSRFLPVTVGIPLPAACSVPVAMPSRAEPLLSFGKHFTQLSML